MVIFVNISISTLLKQKQSFDWPPTKKCQCCGKKLWSHGYVEFKPTDNDIMLLKRLRCNSCKRVYTLKPHQYRKHFRTGTYTIFKALNLRLTRQPSLDKSKCQLHLFWLSRMVYFLKFYFPTRSDHLSLAEWLRYFVIKEIPFLEK